MAQGINLDALHIWQWLKYIFETPPRSVYKGALTFTSGFPWALKVLEPQFPHLLRRITPPPCMLKQVKMDNMGVVFGTE